jgi:transposase InsO family protein
LDRHNHETIGRAVSDKNDTELVLAALENAQSESLNKTLKRQEINISDYGSREESAESIFRFIDLYNKYRPHSSLGGMTPVEFKMSQNFFMKE